MMATIGYRQNRPLNPVHAILLGFPAALFTAVLMGDIALAAGAARPWVGFAFWLIVGGVLTGGIVLLWVLIGLMRARAGRLRRSVVYLAALLAMCTLGLGNAAAHLTGTWAGTLAGITLSASSCALALIAAWTGYLGVPRQPGE